MYSQENEESLILSYFKDEVGTLLSIGENDGVTLSNTRQLILNGWSGVLVEPSGAFERLKKLYENKWDIICYKTAIGTETGVLPFYESSNHVRDDDTGLISTLDPLEVRRWKGSKFDNFTLTECQCMTWRDFYKDCIMKKFDFITIDAEGYDLAITQQMDMGELGCRMICVEFNAVMERKKQFEDYLSKFKFKLFGVTYHNLIFAHE